MTGSWIGRTRAGIDRSARIIWLGKFSTAQAHLGIPQIGSSATGSYSSNFAVGSPIVETAGMIWAVRPKKPKKWCLPALGGTLIGLVLSCSAPAQSAPADGEQSPYPDVTRYPLLAADDFRLRDSPDIWFLSTSGLNCGIWDDGSFGCAGDIPGAPPGTSRIGWFRGDARVHYDLSVGIRWPSGQAQRVLPLRSSVEYDGTTCSATADGSIYCGRGHSRFFITPTATWLN